jgi:hypothetical protein
MFVSSLIAILTALMGVVAPADNSGGPVGIVTHATPVVSAGRTAGRAPVRVRPYDNSGGPVGGTH